MPASCSAVRARDHVVRFRDDLEADAAIVVSSAPASSLRRGCRLPDTPSVFVTDTTPLRLKL
jgi:hypothetical protein